MFYVKKAISSEEFLRVELECDNVFTICPDCGREHAVDLGDLISGGWDGDLYGISIRCPECSALRKK